MSAHRYWRILVTAVEGSSIVSITDFRLYDQTYTDQIGSGTASASSTLNGFVPANAFDSDVITSFWASGSATMPGSQWLKYDFGSGNDKDIAAARVTSRSGADRDQAPKDFKIQWSDDDSSWTDFCTVTNEATWGTVNGMRWYGPGGVIDPPPEGKPATTKQTWRVRCTAADGNTELWAVAGVEMRITAAGSDQCTGGTAITSGLGAGTAADAFDANAATHYASCSVPGHWLAYTFASPKNIIEMAIQSRSSFLDQSPKDFTIDYWDQTAWVNADTITGETGWGVNETRVFTFGSSSVARPVVGCCC